MNSVIKMSCSSSQSDDHCLRKEFEREKGRLMPRKKITKEKRDLQYYRAGWWLRKEYCDMDCLELVGAKKSLEEIISYYQERVVKHAVELEKIKAEEINRWHWSDLCGPE